MARTNYTATVRLPCGLVIQVHAPYRYEFGDVLNRKVAQGAEVIDVSFPED